jgi:hypothetical protein
MDQRASLSDLLIAANRILLKLVAIDPAERTTARSLAVQECLRVYADLLLFQASASISDGDGKMPERCRGAIENPPDLFRRGCVRGAAGDARDTEKRPTSP